MQASHEHRRETIGPVTGAISGQLGKRAERIFFFTLLILTKPGFEMRSRFEVNWWRQRPGRFSQIRTQITFTVSAYKLKFRPPSIMPPNGLIEHTPGS